MSSATATWSWRELALPEVKGTAVSDEVSKVDSRAVAAKFQHTRRRVFASRKNCIENQDNN